MAKSTKKVYMGPVEFSPYRAKKGESYMNEPQKAHFREILLNWKEKLMEEIEFAKQSMQHESETYADLVDSAAQETNVSLEIKKRDRERKLIKKIDSTIERIEGDDYGFCDQCGVDIGVRRLEARPTANLCVDCKTLDEIKEKQLTGG